MALECADSLHLASGADLCSLSQQLHDLALLSGQSLGELKLLHSTCTVQTMRTGTLVMPVIPQSDTGEE